MRTPLSSRAQRGIRTFIAALGMTFLACRADTEQTQETHVVPVSSVVAESAAVALAVKPTRDYLTCSPTTVGPDSTLVLRMRRPHGSSMHIASPDRTPYIVVFHGEGGRDRGARKSLMTPQAFEQLTEVRLAVATLTGGVWMFGRDTNEVVFRAPGIYRIWVGNDMETDGPDYAECLVSFRPRG